MPFPPPGDLPDLKIEPMFHVCCMGRRVLYHEHHLGSLYTYTCVTWLFIEKQVWKSCSVVSNSLCPHGLSPIWFFCPRNPPCKNSGVGSHSHWVGCSQPRDRTWVSHISGRFFTIWATREVHRERGLIQIIVKYWKVDVKVLYQFFTCSCNIRH